MRESLTKDGVFAINLISAVSPPDDRAWKAVYRTLSASYPHVRAFVASDPNEGLANILLFASTGPLEAGATNTGPRVAQEITHMLSQELRPDARDLQGSPMLTDDFAPLDALLAGTARRWRRLLQQAMPEVLLD